jgi:DNA polymerase II small subunit/DNA polymerase delta subunit B
MSEDPGFTLDTEEVSSFVPGGIIDVAPGTQEAEAIEPDAIDFPPYFVDTPEPGEVIVVPGTQDPSAASVALAQAQAAIDAAAKAAHPNEAYGRAANPLLGGESF